MVFIRFLFQLIGYDPRSTMPGANAEIVQHPRNFSQFEPSGSKQSKFNFLNKQMYR